MDVFVRCWFSLFGIIVFFDNLDMKISYLGRGEEEGLGFININL